MRNWTLCAALMMAGCASDHHTELKQCAAALVTMSLAAECTALNAVNNSCTFTLSDLRALREAGADKQNYCPIDTTDGSANQ